MDFSLITILVMTFFTYTILQIFLIKLNNTLLSIYPTVRFAHWNNVTYSLYLNKVAYASLPLPLATQRFLL